jgi:hypothetical protein
LERTFVIFVCSAAEKIEEKKDEMRNKKREEEGGGCNRKPDFKWVISIRIFP